MNKILIKTILERIFIIGSIFSFSLLRAQIREDGLMAAGNDTLSLEQVESVVLKNHPVVREAEEALNKADAQTGLAKTGYYPDVDAGANVSNVGPVPSLTVPDLGTFKLFPTNNFTAGINVHQNIYDFGKTASNVAFSNASRDLQEKSLATIRQNLTINVIKNYFSILYLQEAIKIKDEQLDVLEKHLDYVKKKKATGSGTSYDILSTQVKISNIENQKLDLISARDSQLSMLNGFLGLPARTFHTVKDTLNIVQPDIPEDSVIIYALTHRDEMQIARKRTNLAALHLDVVKTQNRPSLNFIAQGGWKNGFVPEINKVRANYMIGLGLHVPIFDANRVKYNVLMAESSVKTSSLESELTRRNISSEVIKSETDLTTAAKKLEQSELQLSQAQEAFRLAQTNYSAGSITNLDLLDASTNVSESKLMVLKSRIDYTVSIYLFEASLGQPLYR